jgi:hypothetical protein
MRIFVSHASEQRRLAEQIVHRLNGDGHRVEPLRAGEPFDGAIRTAIRRSDLFIFLISPHSVASGRYTHVELAVAEERWNRRVGHVLPVMVAPTAKDDIPPYLLSVTILEPRGEIVAAIGHHVDSLRRLRQRRLVVSSSALLTVGLTASLFVNTRIRTPGPIDRRDSGPDAVNDSANALTFDAKAAHASDAVPPDAGTKSSKQPSWKLFFPDSKRCRPELEHRGSRWWLLCGCPEGLSGRPLLVERAEGTPTSAPWRRARQLAKREGWECP